MDPSPLHFTDEDQKWTLSRDVQAGRARRLAHGIYSSDLSTPSEVLFRRHWLQVLAHACPGAIIADRSAQLAAPDKEGFLFVIHSRMRPLELPGLVIVPRPGHGPLEDDISLPHDLWLSSRERALVENLRPSRAVKGRPPRTLTRRELHQWIAQLRRSEGPERLNRIRDRAREIAGLLEMAEAFPQLDEAIGAALGTREVDTEVTALAAAQRGRPVDERRERTLTALAEHLDARAPSPRSFLPGDRPRLNLLPFFEAYFSNFIEGTEFTVEEAATIVFSGEIPAARPADAHDILGTYRVVGDDAEMSRRPQSSAELIQLLKARHARIMEGRPEKRPGELKQRSNRAGSTEFVAPDLVEGTLSLGFSIMDRLADPFARAAFMMFLISEVHPFDDGNGRVARVMMNAELVGAHEHRIIIPTVFRNEYLGGLRALTHNQEPGPLTRVLDFAQRYTAQVDFSTLDSARAALTATNAFLDPTEASDRGIRLTLPSQLQR